MAYRLHVAVAPCEQVGDRKSLILGYGEESKKASKGVHLEGLAKWIDARRAAADQEYEQLCS
jgi:hypothetical protein